MKFLFIFIFIISCGNPLKRFAPSSSLSDLSTTDAAISEEFSYHFEEDDCVAENSAPTLDRICFLMLDEKSNNACARGSREELYSKECES